MKTLAIILLTFASSLFSQGYVATVIFVDTDNFGNIDTFYFELPWEISDCNTLNESSYKEVTKPEDTGGPKNVIWYNKGGVESYIDYFDDFHCWAFILYDKKRLYLSN